MSEREDMDAAELAMRKFLKQLGVTGHQQVAVALAKAVADGSLSAGDTVSVTARIDIPALGFSHDLSGNLIAPK